jgi:hypothetical protein
MRQIQIGEQAMAAGKYIGLAVLTLTLTGCAALVPEAPDGLQPPQTAQSDPAADGPTRPRMRPDQTASAPPENARTVEQFDTTSAQDRREATETQPAGRVIGTTIASLGDVTQPGFWLETPLVDQPMKGQVSLPGAADKVALDLIPIDGPDTAGSRISLAAMRLLGVPLTDLPELEVRSDG